MRPDCSSAPAAAPGSRSAAGTGPDPGRSSECPSQAHIGDDHDGAGDNPGRITADVAGLSAAQEISRSSCDFARAVYSAVDDADIRGAPEQLARTIEHWLDH